MYTSVTCMRVMKSSIGEALTARRDWLLFADRPRGDASSSSTRQRPRPPADRPRRPRDDRRTGEPDDEESERSRADEFQSYSSRVDCGGGGGGGMRTLMSVSYTHLTLPTNREV